MSPTLVHLLINHLPIVGSLLGGLVLAHGMGVKSFQTIIAAYYIMVLSAIGALVAFFTGEYSKKTIETNWGNIHNETIGKHELYANFSLATFMVLGVISIIALFAVYKKLSYANLLAKFIMALCILSFLIVMRTGYLGLLIRHTEIPN